LMDLGIGMKGFTETCSVCGELLNPGDSGIYFFFCIESEAEFVGSLISLEQIQEQITRYKGRTGKTCCHCMSDREKQDSEILKILELAMEKKNRQPVRVN
jgi:hypothetical protein